MSQDRESGAAASAWGRATAKKIARAIGATIPTGASNECSLNGEAIVIKCAAATTDQVGVTYSMLPRIRYVLAAFEQPNGTFDLYRLDAQRFAQLERPTASRGRAKGKVGLVRRTTFETNGSFVGNVVID